MGSYFGNQPNNMKNIEKAGNSSTSSAKKGKNKCSTSNNTNTNTNTNNSEKPKQPQRGLGVAQLEKIRLHSQMASCGMLPHHQVPHHFINSTFQHVPEDMRIQVGYAPPPQPPLPPFCYSSPSVPSSSYGYHHHHHHHPNNYMIAMGDHMERANNIRYNESQLCNTARWNPNNNFRVAREPQPYLQQPGMVTRHLLSHVDQQQQNLRNNMFESRSSSCQNSEENEDEELDLELKL